MDVSAFSQIVSTVGFPIACCIAMFWQMNKQTELHKQEMDSMKEALNQNTSAINKLVIYMQGKEVISNE